jgi:hypothetical protein
LNVVLSTIDILSNKENVTKKKFKMILEETELTNIEKEFSSKLNDYSLQEAQTINKEINGFKYIHRTSKIKFFSSKRLHTENVKQE